MAEKELNDEKIRSLQKEGNSRMAEMEALKNVYDGAPISPEALYVIDWASERRGDFLETLKRNVENWNSLEPEVRSKPIVKSLQMENLITLIALTGFDQYKTIHADLLELKKVQTRAAFLRFLNERVGWHSLNL